jgi:hypothetical protein
MRAAISGGLNLEVIENGPGTGRMWVESNRDRLGTTPIGVELTVGWIFSTYRSSLRDEEMDTGGEMELKIPKIFGWSYKLRPVKRLFYTQRELSGNVGPYFYPYLNFALALT